MLNARRQMMEAEEALSLLERRTTIQRRTTQATIEELQGRLGQLRGGDVTSGPVDRKFRDLDRKLDDMLRELTELRRELKK